MLTRSVLCKMPDVSLNPKLKQALNQTAYTITQYLAKHFVNLRYGKRRRNTRGSSYITLWIEGLCR